MEPDYSFAKSNLTEALKVAEWKVIQAGINHKLALMERDLVKYQLLVLEVANGSEDTGSGTDGE